MMPKLLHQNGLRIDHKSANDKQGIANRHHLVISTEFSNFSTEISLSQAISTKVAQLCL